MTALTLLAALLVGTLAVARATRLATSDHYPPAEALRRWWWNQTVAKGGWRSGWVLLLTDEDLEDGCPFCFAPYAAAVNLAWALLAGVWVLPLEVVSWAGAWWVVNVWAAVSYAAAMVVVRDEPPAE